MAGWMKVDRELMARADLTWPEKAVALALIDKPGIGVREIAARTAVPRSLVYRTLKKWAAKCPVAGLMLPALDGAGRGQYSRRKCPAAGLITVANVPLVDSKCPAAGLPPAPPIRSLENQAENQTLSAPSRGKPRSAPDPEPCTSGLKIGLVSGATWPVPDRLLAQWRGAYPAVDVAGEIRKADAWCEANPTRRKTERGASRYLNGWLAREQDRPHPATNGHSNGSHAPPSSLLGTPVAAPPSQAGSELAKFERSRATADAIPDDAREVMRKFAAKAGVPT